MPDRELPSRPNLEQYKKQAKDLARDCELGIPGALTRISRHHPRFHKLTESEMRNAKVALADAQLVIAREHGFESWPRFPKHIETLNLIRSVASLADPAAAFIEVASPMNPPCANFSRAIRKAPQPRVLRTIGMRSPIFAFRGISGSTSRAPKRSYAPLGLFSMPEPARTPAGLK